MRRRSIFFLLVVCLPVIAWIAVWALPVTAEVPACRYYKVRADLINVSKDPRADSAAIDVLDKDEIVCVTRDQKVGDRDWVYIADKISKLKVHSVIEGWTNLRLLQPLTPAEIAAVSGAPTLPPVAVQAPATVQAPAAVQPPVAAPAPVGQPPLRTLAAPPVAGVEEPAPEDVLRFGDPIPFGPFPVNGSTIEQLAKGTPMFSPIEGLEENVWKKNCVNCHKWDRQSLCEQGASYAKNPRFALRHPHPYGGGFKAALMHWAKSGCQ